MTTDIWRMIDVSDCLKGKQRSDKSIGPHLPPVASSRILRQANRGIRQRRNGSWKAQLLHPVSRQMLDIGTYSTEQEAARAYDAALERIYNSCWSKLKPPSGSLVKWDPVAPSSATVQQDMMLSHETPVSRPCSSAPLQDRKPASPFSKRKWCSATADVTEKAAAEVVIPVNCHELSIDTPGSKSPNLCQSGQSSCCSADDAQSDPLELPFVHFGTMPQASKPSAELTACRKREQPSMLKINTPGLSVPLPADLSPQSSPCMARISTSSHLIEASKSQTQAAIKQMASFQPTGHLCSSLSDPQEIKNIDQDVPSIVPQRFSEPLETCSAIPPCVRAAQVSLRSSGFTKQAGPAAEVRSMDAAPFRRRFRYPPPPFYGPPPHPMMMHPSSFPPPYFLPYLPHPYHGYLPYPPHHHLHAFPPFLGGPRRGVLRRHFATQRERGHDHCTDNIPSMSLKGSQMNNLPNPDWPSDSFPFTSLSAGLCFNSDSMELDKMEQTHQAATLAKPSELMPRPMDQEPSHVSLRDTSNGLLQQTISSAFDGQDLEAFLRECLVAKTSSSIAHAAATPQDNQLARGFFSAENEGYPTQTDKDAPNAIPRTSSPFVDNFEGSNEASTVFQTTLPGADLNKNMSDFLPSDPNPRSLLEAVVSDSLEDEIDLSFLDDNNDIFSDLGL